MIGDGDVRKLHIKVLMNACAELDRHDFNHVSSQVLEEVITSTLRLLLSLLNIDQIGPALALDLDKEAFIVMIARMVQHVQEPAVPALSLKLLTKLTSLKLGDGRRLPLQVLHVDVTL